MFRSGRRLASLSAVLAVLLVTGCTSGSSGTQEPDPTDSSSPTSTAPPKADLEITPRPGTKGVMPDAPIKVKARTGDLTKVSVTTLGGGDAISGSISGRTWTSSERLAPSSTYTVAVTAEGPEGGKSTREKTFSTHEPDVNATYGIVYNTRTVGVAMPVSIQFDSAVTDPKYRQAIEKAVSVETTPRTKGAWGWLDNRQLMWRPKEFWEPGTEVTVNAPLTGYQTGPDKWVSEDLTGSMTIGRQQSSHVDIADHSMTVKRDGQKVKTFPVSSGKPGKETETRSGMKVVIGKKYKMTMDSETVGIEKGEPGYYKVDTKYNVRVTWTGEFIHSAPWSVGAQGSTNVSHGCVNMAPKNAKWFYEHSLPGDPVNFTGSDREFKPQEGIGVWQYSWQEWQQQSALA